MNTKKLRTFISVLILLLLFITCGFAENGIRIDGRIGFDGVVLQGGTWRLTLNIENYSGKDINGYISINIAKKEENPSMLHFMRHECCLSCRILKTKSRIVCGFSFIIQQSVMDLSCRILFCSLSRRNTNPRCCKRTPLSTKLC